MLSVAPQLTNIDHHQEGSFQSFPRMEAELRLEGRSCLLPPVTL